MGNASSRGEKLLEAAQRGDVGSVHDLLAVNANANHTRDELGETPMHLASEYGFADIVQELLAHGATVDAAKYNGETSLHLASENGHSEIVQELLVRGATVDASKRYDGTPLILASRKGHLDIVKQLLAYGATVDAASFYGDTPLQRASSNGHSDIVKELLAHGATVDAADCSGQTPLHDAISIGNLKIVRQLLAYGATAVDTKNWNGKTPLQLALEYGHANIVGELLAHAPIIDAAENNGEAHLSLRKQYFGSLTDRLNSGALRKIGDSEGNTARDEGNDQVTALVDGNHPPKIYSILAAADCIRQVLEDTRGTSSDLLATGFAILDLCLKLRVHRQQVLTTGVFIAAILRQDLPDPPPALLAVLEKIMEYIQTTLLPSQTWHWQPDHQHVDEMHTKIALLQGHLVATAKELNLHLKVQVHGDIDDLRSYLGRMMTRMETMDEHLNLPLEMPEKRQMDSLVEMAIQLQRGLEFYKLQVALGNIQQDQGFEKLVKSNLDKICSKINLINQAKNTAATFQIDKIEPWILSSNDIEFDPSNDHSALGKGGFATVFKGKYHGRAVAVKRFDQICHTDSDDFEKLIAREIKAWKDISHQPYILTLVGVCTKVPKPIVVSELCRNNIRRYVRDNSAMLLPLVYQFAQGLASLHAANTIHRDIKGDNVLVTLEDTVAIADFGLSRTVTSLEKTKTTWSGTLNWMSPEQYFMPRSVTEKSDVWSFGMTLWEIVCNKQPFFKYSEYEMREEVFQTNHERPKRLKAFESNLDPLWTLCTMCWQLKPANRPSAAEIVEFLNQHYSSEINLMCT